MDERTFDMFAAMLADSHLCREDDVATLLGEHVRAIGCREAVLFLADYDQRSLVPLPVPDGPARTELDIDGTVAGRSFRTMSVQAVAGEDGGQRVWVPVVDGSERVGVLELDFPERPGERVHAVFSGLAALVAHLVMTKSLYGDLFERVRRRQPMSLAAELLWQLLPPLTFGTDRVVITAALAPIHDVGGDAFDYAVNGDTARFAIFDALGHGLPSGMMATVALAAYRNSRRSGLDLEGAVHAIDGAIATHIGRSNYVTGVLAELQLSSGRLRWCIAGHPRPLLVRRGRAVKTLEAGASLPFGLGTAPGIGEAVLEPDDRIFLYTDGITDGRGADGEPFGIARFVDLVSRTSSSSATPPETMRRLMHAVLAHQLGRMRDDATALIVQWPGAAAEQLQIGDDPHDAP